MKKCKLTVGLKFDLVSHKIAMLMDKDAWMEVMVRSDRRFGRSVESIFQYHQVKITSNNEDMLRSACEQFADKKVGDIQDIARLTSLSNIKTLQGIAKAVS